MDSRAVGYSMRCSFSDINDIYHILSHESVFRYLVDDSKKNPESALMKAHALISDLNTYVLRPREGSLFIFAPTNHVTYEMHVATIDGPARKHAKEDAKAAVIWMLENTKALKFIGFTPTCNRRAVVFARMCGLKKEGCITKTYMKDGVLYDNVVFGIDRKYIEENGLWAKCLMQPPHG